MGTGEKEKIEGRKGKEKNKEGAVEKSEKQSESARRNQKRG